MKRAIRVIVGGALDAACIAILVACAVAAMAALAVVGEGEYARES